MKVLSFGGALVYKTSVVLSLEMALHVRTTLLNSQPLTERLGLPVCLKMESKQNSGSFKLRGIGLLCSRVSIILMRAGSPGYKQWACYYFRQLLVAVLALSLHQVSTFE